MCTTNIKKMQYGDKMQFKGKPSKRVTESLLQTIIEVAFYASLLPLASDGKTRLLESN